MVAAWGRVPPRDQGFAPRFPGQPPGLRRTQNAGTAGAHTPDAQLTYARSQRAFEPRPGVPKPLEIRSRHTCRLDQPPLSPKPAEDAIGRWRWSPRQLRGPLQSPNTHKVGREVRPVHWPPCAPGHKDSTVALKSWDGEQANSGDTGTRVQREPRARRQPGGGHRGASTTRGTSGKLHSRGAGPQGRGQCRPFWPELRSPRDAEWEKRLTM